MNAELERRVAYLERLYDELERRLRAVEAKAADAGDLKSVLPS
jgi:hypothetical protein